MKDPHLYLKNSEVYAMPGEKIPDKSLCDQAHKFCADRRDCIHPDNCICKMRREQHEKNLSEAKDKYGVRVENLRYSVDYEVWMVPNNAIVLHHAEEGELYKLPEGYTVSVSTQSTKHMCVNVKGALRNKSFNIWEDDDGNKISAKAAEGFLRIAEYEGKKVIPMGEECEGFSYETGCPGHIKSQVATILKAEPTCGIPECKTNGGIQNCVGTGCKWGAEPESKPEEGQDELWRELASIVWGKSIVDAAMKSKEYQNVKSKYTLTRKK